MLLTMSAGTMRPRLPRGSLCLWNPWSGSKSPAARRETALCLASKSLTFHFESGKILQQHSFPAEIREIQISSVRAPQP